MHQRCVAYRCHSSRLPSRRWEGCIVATDETIYRSPFGAAYLLEFSTGPLRWYRTCTFARLGLVVMKLIRQIRQWSYCSQSCLIFLTDLFAKFDCFVTLDCVGSGVVVSKAFPISVNNLLLRFPLLKRTGSWLSPRWTERPEGPMTCPSCLYLE